jgi:hypothetical protein
LAPLERLVFVMSVLEGYSIKECSLLLNCTTADNHENQNARFANWPYFKLAMDHLFPIYTVEAMQAFNQWREYQVVREQT